MPTTQPVSELSLALLLESDASPLDAAQAFARSVDEILDGKPHISRTAQPPPDALHEVARRFARQPPQSNHEAIEFFSHHFTLENSTSSENEGFCTAYFEPEYAASLERHDDYQFPLRRAPPIVRMQQPNKELLASLKATTRAMIERGALQQDKSREKPADLISHPWVWLRNELDCYLTHIQGSARLRLDDGSIIRAAYEGRNRADYTSIGQILAKREVISLAKMSVPAIRQWARDHPSDLQELLYQNDSYIFFMQAHDLLPDLGPKAAAGVQLTPLRSVAIDRSLHYYGMPVFVRGKSDKLPSARLWIAQDTGSAIVGKRRLDLFLGSGAQLEAEAGNIADEASVFLSRPRIL